VRIAFVSDIHGNLPALRAVVADIKRRGVDRVVNLGDSLSGPLLDRPVQRMSAADAHARARLSARSLEWIASQRPTHRLDDEVVLCHASPRSDLEYLLETVTRQGIRLASAEEIAERRGNTPARLIACGHSHVPRALRAADGCLLLNPGSVGLPGFDDDHPFPHWVDNGSPDARYAIAERGADGCWTAELLVVPYDFCAMAELARHHGREDWAVPLRVGYALRASGAGGQENDPPPGRSKAEPAPLGKGSDPRSGEAWGPKK